MRGAGGPLLCIGDLLSDLGEADNGGSGSSSHHSNLQQTTSVSNSDLNLQPSDLPKLFQETYDQLNEALAGTDHTHVLLSDWSLPTPMLACCPRRYRSSSKSSREELML